MRPAVLLGILALGVVACSNGRSERPDLQAAASTAPTAPPTTPLPATTAPPPSGPTTSLGPPPPELNRPQLNDQSPVSTAGIGPLTFGKTVSQSQTILGTRLLTESGLAPSGECYFVKPEQGPAGVFMLITKSTFERVDIRSGNVKTRSGLGIGTTVDQLKSSLRDQLQQQGNTYTFVPTSANDANYRVVFETDGAKVTSFRAGQVPQVNNVAGC